RGGRRAAPSAGGTDPPRARPGGTWKIREGRPMNDLKGKAVLVTGGSTGIGAAAARAFARQGSRVVIQYNASEEAATALVEEIRADGGEADMVGGDVRDLANVTRIVAQAQQRLGRIDVLVNNVGSLVRRTPVGEYTVELLDEILDINVRQ